MKLLILFSLAVIAAAGATNSANEPHHVYSRAEPFTKGLGSKLKSWADRFPSISRLIESKTATLPESLQQVINNGYTHYSESAMMEVVEGIKAENFDFFVNYLVNTLEITKDKYKYQSFRSSLDLIRYADNTDWTQVDMIFNQQDGANSKYFCILGHRDASKNTYDFMIAEFMTTFRLEPNIILIEERKSHQWGLIQRAKIHVERIPASLKLADVELLKSFFNQAALARFAKMEGIHVPQFDQAFVDPLTVIGVISAGLDVVPKLINAFKTTSTSTIVKEIVGEGFTKYEQSARSQVVQGMTSSNVENRFLPALPRLLTLAPNIMEGVETAITLGMFAEAYTWNDYKILFNQDKSSTNKVQFVDAVCSNRGDDKFNIILVSVEQIFELAPDIKYIENAKSYVGGIYSSTKIERKEYPRSLTQKDLEVLMGFFHITVFKRLAAQYGLPIPQIPRKLELPN